MWKEWGLTSNNLKCRIWCHLWLAKPSNMKANNSAASFYANQSTSWDPITPSQEGAECRLWCGEPEHCTLGQQALFSTSLLPQCAMFRFSTSQTTFSSFLTRSAIYPWGSWFQSSHWQQATSPPVYPWTKQDLNKNQILHFPKWQEDMIIR